MSENNKKENTTYEDMILKLPPDTKMVEVPKRKRGRPPKTGGRIKKGATGNYFQPVEDNILIYIKTEDKAEKDRIFNEYIYQPIYDMVCTIYRLYFNGSKGNFIFEETNEKEIIDDTYSFLLTKFDKFKPGMRSKKYPDREVTAYSYYQTVIKNYIRLKSIKFQKKLDRNISYEATSSQIYTDEKYSYSIDEMPIANQLISGTIERIKEVLDDTTTENNEYKLTKNDIKVGYALIDVLSNWDNLFSYMGSQKFNKSSILYFLQETTLLSDKEIKESLKKYKDIYFENKKTIL
jgi:hypothetical protein